MEGRNQDAFPASRFAAIGNFETFARMRELQGQLEVLDEQASKTTSKAYALNVAIKETELGLTTLDSLADSSARTFRQVARMFVLESPQSLRKQLVVERDEKRAELAKVESFQKSLEAKQRELLSSQ